MGGGGGGTREICVRLRPAGAQSTFLPYECVLGTMLHEITHNIVSPHNGDFYKLLDELTQAGRGQNTRGAATEGRQGVAGKERGGTGGSVSARAGV